MAKPHVPAARTPIVSLISRYDWVRKALLNGYHLNTADIAERLECDRKTAQRYINRLREQGYKIEYDAGLNGFVVLKTPVMSREKAPKEEAVADVLRRAVVWAEKHHGNKTPRWLAKAKKLLKKS